MPRETQSSRASAAVAPVASKQLAAQVLKRLRERILNWYYPPGHHLAEQAICEEFSASRIPVREALRALFEQGLVDKVPNCGCYVKQPDVEGTQQLYDLRLALELYVVETLAQRPKPPLDVIATERAYWEPFLDVRADEKVDGDELVTSDERFHLSLAEAVGNVPIIEALKTINARLRFVRLVVITTPHRVQETAGEHLAILKALAKRDAEAARRALRQNLNHARNKIEIAISRALMKAHRKKP